MTFGDIPGVPVGAWFNSKQALSDAGVHKQIMGGMCGGQDGTTSIVMNEGYLDDEDSGEVILYTGHGGQDGAGNQISDQEWTRANAGMRVNHEKGLPVRVVRGYKLTSSYAPPSGYRYDGLYTVERCWREPSTQGPMICRFELRETEAGRTVAKHGAEPPARFEADPAVRTSNARTPERQLPDLTEEQRERIRKRVAERKRNG